MSKLPESVPENAVVDRLVRPLVTEVFEAGRAGVLILDFEDGSIFANNVHNFDLKQVHSVANKIGAYVERAKRNSLGRSIAFIGGDFNYIPAGEKAARVGVDGSSFPTVDDASSHISKGRPWASVLRQCVELFQPDDTRIGAASNGQGDHYFIASRIDRLYASWLPLQHSLLNVKTCTIDRIACQSTNGSDHVAVGCTISIKQSAQASCQPIPRWLANHPLFQETFNKLVAHVDLEKLEPFVALRVMKILMRKASRMAAKLALKSDEQSPAIKMQLVLQFSRALASQDSWLACRVLEDLPVLHDLVEVDDGRVAIINHSKLDEVTQGIVREAIADEIELANKSAGTKRARGGRLAALHRQSLLWAPFAKKAINVAIIRSDGSVTCNAEQKACELGQFWGNTFSAKNVDVADAHCFLQEFGCSFQFNSTRLPGQKQIESFLACAQHSAAGPDGIPYGAWRATYSVGSRVLFRVLAHLCAGNTPPDDFNESLGIFPAKGTSDDDSALLLKRAASDTRPLSCKNCDNKTLSGVVNLVMTPKIASHADDQQEGFVKGRQGINNVITMDCHSRVLDAVAASNGPLPVDLLPLLLLFDFAAAFPSLAHDFIFAMLQFHEVPVGLDLFLRALYYNNRCYAVFDGVRHFLYTIYSGILQGCPVSGSLFVMAIDPFLRMLRKKVFGARTKAFADDIASALGSLSLLRSMFMCFERFRKISGLALKPKKCKLLPLGAPLDRDLHAKVKDYINKTVPGWNDFAICDSGEYLGFQLGHKGGTSLSWEKPLQKFQRLVGELSAWGVSASIGTQSYVSKIASVTSYVEQLCTPSQQYLLSEVSAIEKVLHCPHNTLPKDAPYLLHQAGMLRFPCLKYRALAAQMRTALKTCSCWRSELKILNSTRAEYGPLMNVRHSLDRQYQLKDNPWWQSEAFADVLDKAAKIQFTVQANSQQGFQSQAYHHLLRHHLPTSLSSVLAQRVMKHLAPLEVEKGKLMKAMDHTLQVARRLSPQVGWALVRLWCNGWPTSSRMGVKGKRCILGCEAEDSLRHYVKCARLWEPILTLAKHKCRITLSFSVFDVLALGSFNTNFPDFSLTKHQLFTIVVATDAFNSIRCAEPCCQSSSMAHIKESFRRYSHIVAKAG